MKKKLSKAARKKESTGINNEARKKEVALLVLSLNLTRSELMKQREALQFIASKLPHSVADEIKNILNKK